MEHLDPPDPLIWDERRLWFEERQHQHGLAGTRGQPSEQATALLIDLQAAFCAGAWAAVVILAGAIVEMQAEQSQWRRAAPAKDLAWLRGLRNALLHEDRGKPVLTVEDQWTRRPLWERHARRAVEIVFTVSYGNGGNAGATIRAHGDNTGEEDA